MKEHSDHSRKAVTHTEIRLLRENTGEIIQIEKLPFSLGRGALDCHPDYLIDDKTVSRLHTLLSAKDEFIFARDMGSKNGTFVNGVRISEDERVMLHDGDLLSLYKERFRVKLSFPVAVQASLAHVQQYYNTKGSDETVYQEPAGMELFPPLGESFLEMLFRLIDERGVTDVECYKGALLDRKQFHKMKATGKAPKNWVLALAISLKLDILQTRVLLRTLGLALSPSSKVDIIVEHYIKNHQYNIYEINEALNEHGCAPLGG